MKKLNKKGFMLTETLIASTLLVTVLLVMYIQFKNVLRSYNQSFSYNTVNDLYGLYNVKKYIELENYPAMASRLDSNKFVDLGSCSKSYYSNKSYCEELYHNLNIEKLYLIKENTQVLKDTSELDEDIKDFIKTIKSSSGNGYRLVAKTHNNTYASLKVFNGTSFRAQITKSCNAAAKVKYVINHKDANSNTDIKSPDEKNAQCGSMISLADYIHTENKCLYSTGTSSDTINLTLDESGNVGTIFYKKYESTLTLRYVEQGSNNSVATSRVLDVFCGDKINIEDYIIKVANREFIRATNTSVDVETSNVSVDLIYTIEGASIDG